MNIKLTFVFLTCLVLSIQAAGPYCDLCMNIIDEIKREFNNDFTDVTVDQLGDAIDAQCDVQTNGGLEDSICRNTMNQDKDTLLVALQAGESSQECCNEAGMC